MVGGSSLLLKLILWTFVARFSVTDSLLANQMTLVGQKKVPDALKLERAVTPRTLVVFETSLLKKSNSKLLQILQGLRREGGSVQNIMTSAETKVVGVLILPLSASGHKLTTHLADDTFPPLHLFGEVQYENLVLITPTKTCKPAYVVGRAYLRSVRHGMHGPSYIYLEGTTASFL